MATKIQKTEPAHSILYEPASLTNSTYDGADESLDTIGKYLANKFNESQSIVFKSSFTERITLLWGPPGTGKTTVLAGIVLGWIENSQRNNKPVCIGVGSSNWTAIDNLLIEVAKLIKKRVEASGKFTKDVDVYRVISGLGENLRHEGIVDIASADGSQQTMSLINEMSSPQKCTIVGSTWKQFYNLSKGGDWKHRNAAAPQKWFDLLLIDEASQVKVSQAAAYFLLMKDNANVVFAGDDKQLGPIFGFQMEDHSEGLFDCIYTYMKETHSIQPKQIVENYRSNEDITSWPNLRFYQNKLRSFNSERRLNIGLPKAKPENWPKDLIWNDSYIEILDPAFPIVVLVYPPQVYTVFNPFEAQVVAGLTSLYRLSLNNNISNEMFYEERLGIVTPHRAQRSNIQNLLNKHAGIDINATMVVDTVDRFQGQERDLIIASYTVADKDFVSDEEDFILDPRRFNVSLTRAKSKFIMLISDSILQHLPSDKNVASNASHIQLFAEKYCKPIKKITLSYKNSNGDTANMECTLKYLA
jgi:superfamily I DNA and/or RNA helicase